MAPSLAARAQSTDRAAAQPAASWSSPSLRSETVVGPNGAVTTSTALLANEKWGIGDRKRVEKVTDGVYAMRGWGIASSFAIEAPAGWIVIDTGDHTQAAAEMRAMLEQTLGRKIKVAAILLTHLHYANGTGAFLDPGAEVWGHEHLDRNFRATTGISVLSGIYQARAAAQFGVFHPTSGPDAFPNKLGFTPEKLLAGSSYQPPTQLFPDGRVVDLVVAGMPVQVAPLRTDTSDSVGFYFPGKRLLVTNCMPYGAVFNIYSLRGGSYRNPAVFIQDARWVESKNAQILLDIHGPTLKGQDAVRDAVQRAVDQVQLIHDQTLRQIAHGLDARQAAEQVYMPRDLRGDWENYGQVESHVQQVFNGNDGLVRRRRVRHQSAVRERGSGAYRATDGRRRRGAEGCRRRQRTGRARQLAVDAPADVPAAGTRRERRRGAPAPRRGVAPARSAHLGGQRTRLVPDGGAADRRRDAVQGSAADNRRDPYLPRHADRAKHSSRRPSTRTCSSCATSSIRARPRGCARRSRSLSKATRASGGSSCATACS